ncbi:MAG: RNase adapter RapZ [Nitrospirota bacterium]|nr:RNase adapter RapZ [Thermodesulfovibrionales bacterium]
MKPIIVILTGLSGSGKTVALRALEDSGFFCVDNLPIALIDSFASIISRNREIRKIGIGIDIREKGSLSEIKDVLKTLRKKYQTQVLFLEAEKDVLMRRFRETRRPHPLGGNIDEVMNIEKERLAPLKDVADRVVDSSSFTPHQLRQLITSFYGLQTGRKAMTVVLISFGFKFGAPQNIDLLFDVRFLPNPNFVPELKPLRGTDRQVADYVLKNTTARAYVKKIQEFIDFLIPQYIKEGRSYLTIGVGCTGGNHRAPAIAEKLQSHLRRHPIDLSVVHRDLS